LQISYKWETYRTGHERETSAHARSLYANEPNTSSCYCKHKQISLSHLLQQRSSQNFKTRESVLETQGQFFHNFFINEISLSHKSIPKKLFVYSEITSISFHTKALLNSKKTFWYARMRRRFSHSYETWFIRRYSNRPFSHSKNTAVFTDYRLICTELASFMSKLFTSTNESVVSQHSGIFRMRKGSIRS
jgi:hypothetical protein